MGNENVSFLRQIENFDFQSAVLLLRLVEIQVEVDEDREAFDVECQVVDVDRLVALFPGSAVEFVAQFQQDVLV